MKLSVLTDCFGRGAGAGIGFAQELLADGVEVSADAADFSPEALDAKKKNEYKRSLEICGIKISALRTVISLTDIAGDDDYSAKAERLKRVIDLAGEFDCETVCVGVKPIPSKKQFYDFFVNSCFFNETGNYACEKGVTVAIETSFGKADLLAEFLQNCPQNVGVCFDPLGFSPERVESVVKKFEGRVVYAKVRDGLLAQNPFSGDVPTFDKAVLGKGIVDFGAYFRALNEIGYNGYLAIETKIGLEPRFDMFKAISFVRAKLSAVK